MVDGKSILTLLVLRERTAKPKADDRFEVEHVEQFRLAELVRIRGTAGLKYMVSVWEHRPSARENMVMVAGPTLPTRMGDPLDFIPFVFFGPTDLSPDIEDSPILPLVDVNISHFNTSAALEHGAWWTALPLYVISGGFQNTFQNKLTVGSSTAWILEAGAEAKILEYEGRGLDSLEQRLARKESHMAVLGARLLEDQKAGVETAETVRLRHSGENSVLSSMANTTGRGLSLALSTATGD